VLFIIILGTLSSPMQASHVCPYRGVDGMRVYYLFIRIHAYFAERTGRRTRDISDASGDGCACCAMHKRPVSKAEMNPT